MGTPTIFKRNYPIDYVVVNSNGRRNRQRNTIVIVKLKKMTEHVVEEVEVDVGKIDIFGSFSQGSSNPSLPPLQHRKRPHKHHGHEVDDDNDNNEDDYKGGGGGKGGVRGEGRGREFV